MNGVKRRLREWLPVLIVFGIGIALWQGLTTAFHVQTFLLPKPSDIAHLVLGQQVSPSGTPASTPSRRRSGASLLGAGLGIVTALFLARFRKIGLALMPFAIAANAVPIIAFSPIMNNWFGLLEPVLEDGDRRRALLLPGDGQHAARAHVGPPVVDRADAVVRGG